MFGLQAELLDRVAGAAGEPTMSIVDIWLLVVAAVFVAGRRPVQQRRRRALVVLQGPRRGARGRGRAGAARLLVIVEDPPRYLNTALFLRMLTEIAAIILVTVVMLDLIVPRGGSESGPETDGDRWWAMLASLAIMLVVSFVVIGVAPAHARPPALRAGRAAVRGTADRRSPRCSARCPGC